MITCIRSDIHLFEQIIKDNYADIYFDYTIKNSLIDETGESKQQLCASSNYTYGEHKFSIGTDIKQTMLYNATLAAELKIPYIVNVEYEINPIDSFDCSVRFKEIIDMFKQECDNLIDRHLGSTFTSSMEIWESSKRHDTIER